MKHCIVVSDSFKGSLSSSAIGQIAKELIPQFFPDCQVTAIPVADGGEGTVQCFLEATQAQPVTIRVTGPYGQELDAVYARQADTAIIEMAAAAGLPLVGDRKDPSKTTTYGVGQLIRHAVENGCKKILLGLGGSATNDGGCGCANALGVRFRDAAGRDFCPVGKTLDQIATIDLSDAKALLKDVSITVMCDVTNPLYGPNGAAHVFGPQKGADPAMVQLLDNNLRHYSDVLLQQLGATPEALPGAGAAGGMGAGMVALLGAQLKPGIEAILDTVGFDHHLQSADLVITGEGRIDDQSFQGKVISGVTRRTTAAGVPVIAIVGDVADSAYSAYDHGVSAIFSINRLAIPYWEAMPRSEQDYRRTLEDILRLIQIAKTF